MKHMLLRILISYFPCFHCPQWIKNGNVFEISNVTRERENSSNVADVLTFHNYAENVSAYPQLDM